MSTQTPVWTDEDVLLIIHAQAWADWYQEGREIAASLASYMPQWRRAITDYAAAVDTGAGLEEAREQLLQIARAIRSADKSSAWGAVLEQFRDLA